GAGLEPSRPRRATDATAGRRQSSAQARRAVGLRAAGEPADAAAVPRAGFHPAGDSGRTGHRADHAQAVTALLLPLYAGGGWEGVVRACDKIKSTPPQPSPARRGGSRSLSRYTCPLSPARLDGGALNTRPHDQPYQASTPSNHPQATPLLDAPARFRAGA